MFVDGVEELLFFGEVLQGVGGVLDGAVEAVEGLSKSSRLKLRLTRASMTFSTSAAMTLRRVKPGLSKILQIK